MAVEIYIEEKLGRNWVEKEGVFFTGCFFYDGRFLNDEQVYDCLSKIKTLDDCKILLKNLNGFFSFIIKTQNKVFAVVDRVRSIPLFYTAKDNKLFISNDAEAVRGLTGDIDFDPIAVQEFTSGQVTGADTLFKNVKQVQTGEIVEFSLAHLKKIQLNKIRYFVFTHSENNVETDSVVLENRMLLKFSESIDRLIQYANGRQLVLPLSAGYDSRFIALMLYKKGIKNVLCFSYGKRGNFEAEISKQVADVLGFQWEFVEYTSDLWYETRLSDDYWRYQRFACGWVTPPHRQDWLAVKNLKQNKKLMDNAVFIPGHTGDALAGSDVPLIVTSNVKLNTSRFIYNLIISYYNSLQTLPKEILPSRIKDKWRTFEDRILQNLSIASITSPEEYADACEKWAWQEFNAKHIINSVRVYEFWGYDWYLPFVDREFMLYWMNVPLSYRYGKILYNNVVDKFYFDLFSTEPPPHNDVTIKSRKCKKILNNLRYSIIHWLYIRYKSIIKKSSFDYNDTNNSISAFDKESLQKYCPYIGGINFLLSVDYLLNKQKIINMPL